jgi:hypothetical protein
MASRKPQPAAPVPLNSVALPVRKKESSYSPEESDRSSYFMERYQYMPETRSKLSPGPPEHSWGNGSYERSGRAVRVGQSGPGNQSSPAGTHTDGRPGKPMRPGRW